MTLIVKCLLCVSLLLSGLVCGKVIIRTIAGVPKFGGDKNLAVHALFNIPRGLFFSDKELFITDSLNNVIRKIDKNGIITTVAGIPGAASYSGDGGAATKATFNSPSYIYASKTKELYITDVGNDAIRKVASNGIVSTIAGGTSATLGQYDYLLANQTKLSKPKGVFVTEWNGEVFVCDSDNHVVRKILTNGTMVIVAGVLGQRGYNEQNTTNALKGLLNSPSSIYVTADNEMFIADTTNRMVRKVFLNNNTMITVAGKFLNQNPLACEYYGEGGDALNATLCVSFVTYKESTKQLYIGSYCSIKLVTFYNNGTSTLSTIAGSAELMPVCISSGDYGSAAHASLSIINGMAMNDDGTQLFVSNSTTIRLIDSDSNIISPIAGREPSLSAKLSSPSFLQLTSNNTSMFISDSLNHVVKLLDMNSGSVQIIAGVFRNLSYNGDTGEAKSINLKIPKSLAWDEKNQFLYIADYGNNKIRRVNVQTGMLSTLSINYPYSPFTSYLDSLFYFPQGEELYVADSINSIVYKISISTNAFTRIAGRMSSQGSSGDGGLAINALLQQPKSIFVTSTGEVYILEFFGKIRKIDSNGMISTFVGLFNAPIIDATNGASAITVDEINQKIYLSGLNIVKAYSISSQSLLGDVAGISGIPQYTGDIEDPKQVKLQYPGGMITSSDGKSLYVAETVGDVVRKITNLCEEYQMQPTMAISNSLFSARFDRSCITSKEYFLSEYLPLAELKFKDTNEEFKTIVISEWGQQQNSTINLQSQQLDILNVELNGCDTLTNRSTNCMIQTEYGMIPTNSTSNFLLFPKILSAEFFTFFKTSKYVASLEIVLSFYNIQTNQTDKTYSVDTASGTFMIDGLKHSTTYEVYINTTVKYSNQLVFSSPLHKQQITMLTGISPSGTLQSIQLSVQNTDCTISWQAVPENQRGNAPISHIECHMYVGEDQQLEINTQVITIPYNAELNNPSFYTISNLPLDQNITFLFRVCNAIGCGDFSSPLVAQTTSSPQTQITQQTPSTLLTILLSIIICFVIICVAIIIALILILVLLLIVVIIKKKQSKLKTTDLNQVELVDELLSKEFRIDESKIDLTGSKFIGSGVSGSVITAKYFNMEVAVKIIQKSNAGVESNLTDFYNELKFLNSNTQHVNIIRFFGVYENTKKNHIGMVMELCSNGNLATFVSKHSNLSFAQKLALLQGIANGMQYLHFHNIAHRMIKSVMCIPLQFACGLFIFKISILMEKIQIIIKFCIIFQRILILDQKWMNQTYLMRNNGLSS